MPTIKVNGTEITVPEGTTVLRAAEAAGYKIPYFCYHPALSTPANCRMCLVEIEGQWKLEPGCYTPVRDGMSVLTESDKVKTSRKAVLEFILVNHPIDCPICDQAGECWLQDHYLAYDAQASRVRTEKVSKDKVYPIGPEVIYDGERCILCTRCIRFCNEVTKTSELAVVERGDNAEIRTFPGRKLDNKYSICTADICPVGALTPRSTRFSRRAWLLKSNDSVCTGCARNCAVHLNHFQQRAERYVPRFNPEVNDYWMCDAGRLGVHDLVNDRSLEIRVDGKHFAHWPESLSAVTGRISASGGDGQPRRWAMVLSPQSSAEGLLAAVHFAETCLGEAKLFRGGKPAGEEDDLLIKADKNPNNAAIDLVTEGKTVGDIDALLAAIEAGEVNALYMMGSHFPVDDEKLVTIGKALGRLDLLVNQGIWAGPFSEQAHIVLPASSHAEHVGTYINCDGVAQTVEQAYPPIENSLPDLDIFLKLSRRLQKELPMTSQEDAFKQLNVEAYVPNEEIPAADFHRAPHGPDRSIPGRGGQASAVAGRYDVKVR